ncbi:unnamed protein product [marine sediment metagenome]|uniref:Uncharacterized protein n=1 Tax=marine sediment metagenome TaxID=412755 RepID=X0RF01_9ZZZZ
MTLTKGDHLVIKRDGMILTPDCGESYHEHEVVSDPIYGSPQEGEDRGSYVTVRLKVIR